MRKEKEEDPYPRYVVFGNEDVLYLVWDRWTLKYADDQKMEFSLAHELALRLNKESEI